MSASISVARGESSACPRQQLAEAVHRITSLPEAGPADRLYFLAVAALHELLAVASAAEYADVSLDEIREIVVDARVFHGRWSRTLAHAQGWPRGYAGDFEMVERLLDAAPDGEPGTLAYAIDDCVLQLPIVAQHRAKVAWQAQLVRRALGRQADVRVLSIACGGSRDLMLLEPGELSRLRVVLTDLDPAALALSRTRLHAQVRELTCVGGNALRNANRLRAAGPFDVIVVGGLLDYLPERPARALLRQAFSMLAPGAELGATNITAPNPWRLLLDLITSWSLIARDRGEMAALVRGCEVSSHLELDHTRLTWLMTLSGR